MLASAHPGFVMFSARDLALSKPVSFITTFADFGLSSIIIVDLNCINVLLSASLRDAFVTGCGLTPLTPTFVELECTILFT